MEETLRAAYRELEEEARDYADPAAALATARRRRTRRSAAAAAVAVIAVTGVIGYPPWRSDQGGPSVAGTVAVTTAPLVVRTPASASPPPANGAGTAGALVYTACMHGCPTYVVLADGRQYLLGEQTVPPQGNITLSPDGRWLGMPTATGYELRDLVSGGRHHVELTDSRDGAVYSPWAWSADGRRVLLAAHVDGDVSSYAALSVADGVLTEVGVPGGTEPFGLLDTGELLLFDVSGYGSRATRVELTMSRSGRSITLDGGRTPLVTADGGPAVQVRGDRIHAVAADLSAVITFGLDGKEVGRLPLRPGEEPLAAAGDGFAVLSGTALQVRGGTDARTPHEVPKGALVVLPGQARH